MSGYIVNGAFNGLISTKYGETFYVEPLPHRAVKNQQSDKPAFTTGIIYKDTDINRNSTSYRCNVQPLRAKARPKRKLNKKKRVATHAPPSVKQYNSCPVFLAADSSFYKSVGNEEQAMAKMAYHLSEADQLFRKTKFFETTNEGYIGLVIAAMTVYHDKESEGLSGTIPHGYIITGTITITTIYERNTNAAIIIITTRFTIPYHNHHHDLLFTLYFSRNSRFCRRYFGGGVPTKVEQDKSRFLLP